MSPDITSPARIVVSDLTVDVMACCPACGLRDPQSFIVVWGPRAGDFYPADRQLHIRCSCCQHKASMSRFTQAWQRTAVNQFYGKPD